MLPPRSLTRLRCLPVLLAVPWAAACHAPDADGALPAACATCALHDGQNYRYDAALDVQVAAVQAHADVRVDWSGLSADLVGHPLDPRTDVAGALLLAFPELAPEEIADALVHEVLSQSELALYLRCAPEGTACSLSEFSIYGSTIDPSTLLAEGSGSWLVVIEAEGQQGAAALTFLEPQDAASTTRVAVTEEASALQTWVELEDFEPLSLPAGERAVTLDWSGLRTDGLGNEVDPRRLDLLRLARFDQELAALEARIHDLEAEALDWWELPLGSAPVASLDALPADFTGVDEGDTWLLGLWCSTCDTAAPRFLTQVQVGRLP